MLLMPARYWRGLLRLTFKPHSLRNASVPDSNVPFPGRAKRIARSAFTCFAPHLIRMRSHNYNVLPARGDASIPTTHPHRSRPYAGLITTVRHRFRRKTRLSVHQRVGEPGELRTWHPAEGCANPRDWSSL